MAKYITFKRIYQHLMLNIANLPMPGHNWRPRFVRLGGVNVVDTHCFIGKDVKFDGVHPELVTIEKGVRITGGSSILTHFINPETGRYTNGEVILKEGCFIGTRTVITKPVTIGKGAIVGAGSIVTKDIPNGEVWAGNPAKFIRKRTEKK